MSRSIRLWDYIEFHGQPWQVIAVDGSNVRLRNQYNTTESVHPITEVLGDETFDNHDPDKLPVFNDLRVFETLTDEQAAHARALYEHVVEVLTGVKPGDNEEPNPDYSPHVPIGQRLTSKSEELKATGFKPNTVRALRRYIARFKAEGLAGFVDKRALARQDPAGRSDPALVEIMRACVAEQNVLSTGTRGRVLTNTVIRATEQGIAVPSRATLYRMLARIESDKHPFGLATTRRTQQNRPDRTWSMRNPTRPGELVEMDSNVLDVLVRYPDGSTGRPELTLMVDIATRTILSAVIVPNTTKAIDATLVLTRALAPVHHQPGWGESTRLSRSLLPVDVIAPDEEVREAAAARPVIIPENLTIDRGKAFLSQVFIEACRRLGVSLTMAAPHSPTFKPHVERVFHTINTGFTEHLTGYTGHGVHMRAHGVDNDAALPIQAVQDALDYWIVAYYQNRPHEGLTVPTAPRMRLSPNEAYTALSAIAPPVHATLETEDLIGFLPLEWRAVRADGVHLETLRYDTEDLHHLRGRKSGLPGVANGRWEVRYNPLNMAMIWVHDHENGAWIEAPMVLADRVHGPFSADIARLAMKAARDAQSPEDAVRSPHIAEVISHINRMLDGQTRSASERAAVRRAENTVDDTTTNEYMRRRPNRIEPVPSPAPADDDTLPEAATVTDHTPKPRRRAVLPPEEF